MKFVLLDGKEIRSTAAMHRAFAEALEFPEWYGNNLDALYDMLTERSEEITIALVHTKKLKKALGARWEPFLAMLEDLKGEKPKIHVLIEGEEG